MGIAANELRIGNWYKNKSDDYPFNQIKYGHEIDYVAVYCEPIPLTEKWLLKFGFEWCNEAAGYFDKDHAAYLMYPNVQFHPFCTNDKDCWINLQYVHQLQNLYFALTGEELTIKEL
jgi:hypothetical protein